MSIFQKLVGLFALVAFLIVGGLATYFPLREIAVLRQALAEKGRTYGKLLAKQLESAVTFDDQATAHEITSGLAAEPQFLGLTLFDARGRVVHAVGSVRSQPRLDLAELQLVTTDDRMVVFAPVSSIEGAHGEVVIELSTARITNAKRSIVISTVIAVVLALGFAAIGAWLIARSFARRLRTIAAAAGRVARGDLSAAIRDPRRDEIGTLATAFSRMVDQIRALMAEREEQARVAQQKLERLVAARTAELDARTKALRFVLDSVDQGLFSVDLDGHIGIEMSAAVERLLGPVPDDRMLSTYVTAFAYEQAAWFEACWSYLRDDLLPIDLALEQLPRRFTVQGRELELDYKLVGDSTSRRVVVVITDISTRIARQRAERDQHELAGLVTRLLADHQGFVDFQLDMEHRIASLADPARDAKALSVDVHTMKGSASVFGVASIAELCHELEDRYATDPECAAPIAQQLVERWHQIAAQLAPLTAARTHIVEIDHQDFDDLVAALERLPNSGPVLHMVQTWRHEPVRLKLERLGEHTRRLATQLGKAPVSVAVECDRTRVAQERWPGFWSSLVHVVRNAVDHGIEMPDERVAAGKPIDAAIVLRATQRDEALVVEIEDSGRGIDWERIREVAQRAHLPSATREDLVAAMFHCGLTTRTEATMTSGRGVGLAAAREACVEAGGEVTVDSQPGRGTRFRFVLPDQCWEQRRTA